MTFFIPPVFLFGNNANRVPYDEEKKSEYKTAAETEIKVENWRAKRIAELEEENKRLEEENEKLKEKISELEDVSKDYDLLSKDFITLGEENEKLKSDLSECECSMHFENDEVGFWKREYKRLKKWIKDHCKGYGNLFPEDEMKRQWKKADKKRK